MTVHFARLDSPVGTPGTHVGMEQRLLGYLDAIPTVIPSLAAVHPTVVALAHTSVSYAVGFGEEPTLVERIAKLAGYPAVTASRAILAAFARLGVRRIALATPYSEAVEALGATYWKAAGLEVVACRRLEGSPTSMTRPKRARMSSAAGLTRATPRHCLSAAPAYPPPPSSSAWKTNFTNRL